MRVMGCATDRNTSEVFQDLALVCYISELDTILDYLKYVKGESAQIRAVFEDNCVEEERVPIRYSEWSQTWTEEESDFVVILRGKNT